MASMHTGRFDVGNTLTHLDYAYLAAQAGVPEGPFARTDA